MTTPILEGREVVGCNVCKMQLNPGSDGHKENIDCINALRALNKSQHEAASRLALSLSTRYFAIFEELAHDPECGVQYYTHNEDTGEKTHLGHSTVRGVMAAIFTKFQAMGDWSPMDRLQDELKEEQQLNVKFQKVLSRTEELLVTGKEIPFLLRKEIRSLLDPGGLHLEEDDPPEE
jgi:hypothetical protein